MGASLYVGDIPIHRIIVEVPNGSPTPDINLQSKTVSPSTLQQTVIADNGYDGLESVVVEAIPIVEQSSPNISVDNNGLITAVVNQSTGYVESGEKSTTKQLDTQSTKVVNPSTSEQVVVASGKFTTGDVKVAAMPSGVLSKPTINDDGLVTAKISTSGYLPNTTTEILQLTVQAAKTIIPGTSNQTVQSGRYLTGDIIVQGDSNLREDVILNGETIFGVTGSVVTKTCYIGSGTPSSGLGSNGDLYIDLG